MSDWKCKDPGCSICGESEPPQPTIGPEREYRVSRDDVVIALLRQLASLRERGCTFRAEVVGRFAGYLVDPNTEQTLFGVWEANEGCQCPGLASGLNKDDAGVAAVAFAFDDAVAKLLSQEGTSGRLIFID